MTRCAAQLSSVRFRRVERDDVGDELLWLRALQVSQDDDRKMLARDLDPPAMRAAAIGDRARSGDRKDGEGQTEEAAFAVGHLERPLHLREALGLDHFAPIEGRFPGKQILELYVTAGIPPAEVLRLDTLGAARVMRRDREYGRIAPGYVSDLILIDGDPTINISDIRKVRTVLRGDWLYDSAALWTSMGIAPAP
jgi:hypothetical protein